MFDLDAIEKDWKDNSFRLTDEEIRKIYIAEGVTTKAYSDIVNDFFESLPKSELTAEERLLAVIFNDEESKTKLDENRKVEMVREKLISENYPKKPRLSIESQKKVVEGCMDLVFENTKFFYKKFGGNIPIESLYYVCLESLMKAVKYCVHYSSKNCFRSYASKGILVDVIDFVASKEGIPYRNALAIYDGTMVDYMKFPWFYENDPYIKPDFVSEFTYKKFMAKEETYKPSSVYYMTKDTPYYEDYTEDISNEEFMKDYAEALQKLPEDERMVMSLAYDKDGYPGLTHSEISDYLGISVSDISNIKRRAKKKLKSDKRIIKYR